MSTRQRALLIGALGPTISAMGALWALLKALVEPGRELTVRYIVFDAPHLLIAVGVVVALVSLPVAIEVAVARPEEVELPLLGPEHELNSEEFVGVGWEIAE